MVAQPASRLEERTSRGPSRHTLVWTNATLVWPNNDMLCALRKGGIGNGTNSQFASPAFCCRAANLQRDRSHHPATSRRDREGREPECPATQCDPEREEKTRTSNLRATSAQGHRPCTCGSEATPKAPEPHQRNSVKDDRRSTCGEIAAFPQKFWRPYRNKQRLPSPC